MENSASDDESDRVLLDMAMDEEQQNEQINLIKYVISERTNFKFLRRYPQESKHGVYAKFSGSFSDSRKIISNIRGKKEEEHKKMKHSCEIKKQKMSDYMTYNAMNFGSKNMK